MDNSNGAVTMATGILVGLCVFIIMRWCVLCGIHLIAIPILIGRELGVVYLHGMGGFYTRIFYSLRPPDDGMIHYPFSNVPILPFFGPQSPFFSSLAFVLEKNGGCK